MGSRIRQHVNPMSFRHLDTGAEPLHLPENRRIEVDLGCGEGEFLFSHIARHPEVFLVGVEIRRPLVERIQARIAAEGLQDRLLAVYANLLVDLPILFSTRPVDAVFMQFPDPWFKKRHHKRRMFTDKLAGHILGAMRKDGFFFFQSDVFELALEALEILEARDDVVNVAGAWSFSKKGPLQTPTRRQRYCEEKGLPIWRLWYKKTMAQPATGSTDRDRTT